MQNLARNANLFSDIRLCFCCMRSYGKTYYEILEISKESSAKEIRNAFLKLSKKYHPDVLKSAQTPNTHSEDFLKIREAYETLCKPKLRNAYDQELIFRAQTNSSASRHFDESAAMHRPWEIKPDLNTKAGAYYGINGVGRVSNFTVAGVILIIGIIAAVFGFSSAQQSASYNLQQLDEKSAEASAIHAQVRADAEKFGNDEQLRRMLGRMQANSYTDDA